MKQSVSHIEVPKNIDPMWRIGIVHSSFYLEEVNELVASAVNTLEKEGVKRECISIHSVAGSFEIPLVGAALADTGDVDALIGFGIVVQGETQHAQAIVTQTCRGMMDVQTLYKIPFAFEVLHVDSLEDTRVRLKSKGKEAALAVLHSLAQLTSLRY